MGPGQALAPGALAPGIEPEGSAALCPRELDPLERDYLRLNPLKNPRWITQSRFKAVSTSGASLWCCGCHEGICGRCWRLSEVFQREVRGLVPPQGAGVRGCGRRYHSLLLEPRKRWRKRSSRVELLPEPGSESRFRIPVQNPGSESRRIPGHRLGGERSSWLLDHPGGPQVFSLELSALRSQRPEP